jgi:hypothetical protein
LAKPYIQEIMGDTQESARIAHYGELAVSNTDLEALLNAMKKRDQLDESDVPLLNRPFPSHLFEKQVNLIVKLQKELRKSFPLPDIISQAIEKGFDGIAYLLWSEGEFVPAVRFELLKKMVHFAIQEDHFENVRQLLPHVDDTLPVANLAGCVQKQLAKHPNEVEHRLFMLRHSIKIKNSEGIKTHLQILLTLPKSEAQMGVFKELAAAVPNQALLIAHANFFSHYSPKEAFEKIFQFTKQTRDANKNSPLMEKALELISEWNVGFAALFFRWAREVKQFSSSFGPAFLAHQEQLLAFILASDLAKMEDFFLIVHKLGASLQLRPDLYRQAMQSAPATIHVSQGLRDGFQEIEAKYLIAFVERIAHLEGETCSWIELLHAKNLLQGAPLAKWIGGMKDTQIKYTLLLLCQGFAPKEEAIKTAGQMDRCQEAVLLIEAYQCMNEERMAELFDPKRHVELLDRYAHLSNYLSLMQKAIQAGNQLTLPQFETFWAKVLEQKSFTAETSNILRRLSRKHEKDYAPFVEGLVENQQYEEIAAWLLILPPPTVKKTWVDGVMNNLTGNVLLEKIFKLHPAEEYAPIIAQGYLSGNIRTAIAFLNQHGLMDAAWMKKIAAAAKTGDADEVYKLFKRYFDPEGIAAQLLKLTPAPAIAYAIVEEHHAHPPANKKHQALWSHISSQAVRHIHNPAAQFSNVKALVEWEKGYCALDSQGTAQFREAVSHIKRQEQLWPGKKITSIQKPLELFESICFFTDIESAKNALLIGRICGLKGIKAPIETFLKRCLSFKNFEIYQGAFEWWNSLEEKDKEINDALKTIVHHQLMMAAQTNDDKELNLALRNFNIHFHYCHWNLEIVAYYILCVFHVPVNPEADLKQFLKLFARDGRQLTVQSKAFFELSKIPFSDRPGNKVDGDYLFNFMELVINKLLEKKEQYLDQQHNLLVYVFENLAHLCRIYPLKKLRLRLLICRFFDLRLSSGFDLAGPFYDKKKELALTLSTSPYWSDIDFATMLLTFKENKMIDSVKIGNGLKGLSERLSTHPAPQALHHLLDILEWAKTGFMIFEPALKKQILGQLSKFSTPLLHQYEGKTALEALCSLMLAVIDKIPEHSVEFYNWGFLPWLKGHFKKATGAEKIEALKQLNIYLDKSAFVLNESDPVGGLQQLIDTYHFYNQVDVKLLCDHGMIVSLTRHIFLCYYVPSLSGEQQKQILGVLCGLRSKANQIPEERAKMEKICDEVVSLMDAHERKN